MAELETLEKDIISSIKEAADLKSLEEIRVGAVGKKGSISALMSGLGKMPPEERKSFGQAVNKVKQAVTSELESRKEELERIALNERLETEREDVTLPLRQSPNLVGRIHPISQVWEEITEMGLSKTITFFIGSSLVEGVLGRGILFILGGVFSKTGRGSFVNKYNESTKVVVKTKNAIRLNKVLFISAPFT